MYRINSLRIGLIGIVFSLSGCSRASQTVTVHVSGPIAVFPERIDLGKREKGEEAAAEFVIANNGDSALIIDQFESNCSCTGIERQRDGQYVRVEELKLQPQEQIEVRMRISVRGVPIGAAAKNGVRFRTNDPNKPTGQIEGVISFVTGGVFVVPDTLTFGSVPTGAVVRKIMDVRDDALVPRTLEHITCSHGQVKVRILEPSQNSSLLGKSIAQVEVTVDTSLPGGVDGRIEFHLANAERPPDHVDVLGRVLAPFEVSPQKLVLPRSSGEKVVYTATCLIRSTAGGPITASVESCPAYLTATINEPSESVGPSIFVTVTLNPKSPILSAGSPGKPIRFRCRAGDVESICELSVVVVPE